MSKSKNEFNFISEIDFKKLMKKIAGFRHKQTMECSSSV
jgi:hypothetical protein